MNDSAAVADGPPLAGSTPGLQYVPAPAWIRNDPDPTVPEGELEDVTDDGILRVLHDRQVSLVEPGVSAYVHFVQRVMTRAGAERAANLAIEFDPDHERLEIHTIRVRRNGSLIELARPGAMELLRRESNLERLALNGRLTASFVVPDLRVGDELEIAATHSTSLAVLRGRHASWLVFDAGAPWIETRLRVLHAATRPIALREFNSHPPAEISAVGGNEELRWSLTGQKRLPPEDLAPPWTLKKPCYQLSEFSTWNEVAQIFVSHYQAGELPPEVEAARAGIAAAGSDPSLRAVEWLRFVQGALRYFALSFGDGRLLPRDLDTIWSRRFGDCKDAARLYVAGARALGLDACAALVSTTTGPGLNKLLPAAQLFNHVIVRVRIDTDTYWLDPTLPQQGGTLQKIRIPHAGWALPLTADSNALEALPPPSADNVLHCEDRLTVSKRVDSAARLARQLTFSYWMADKVRHRIANDGSSKVAQQLLQDFKVSWPQAKEAEPPAFTDDPDGNQMVMRCAYEIPSPWKTEASKKSRVRLSLTDPVTSKEFPTLTVRQRRCPILLGLPRRVSWRATIEMPILWSGGGWIHFLETPGLRLTDDLRVEGTTLIVVRDLMVSDWSTPADKADDYIRIATQAHQNTINFFASARFNRIVPSRNVVLSRVARALLRVVLFLIILAVIRSLLP